VSGLDVKVSLDLCRKIVNEVGKLCREGNSKQKNQNSKTMTCLWIYKNEHTCRVNRVDDLNKSEKYRDLCFMTAVDGSYSRFGAKLQKIKHEKKKKPFE